MNTYSNLSRLRDDDDDDLGCVMMQIGRLRDFETCEVARVSVREVGRGGH